MRDSPLLPLRIPDALAHACRRLGVRPSPVLLLVDASRQILTLAARCPLQPPGRPFDRYLPLARLTISTSRFGLGQTAQSNRTPLGLHRVAAKIGAGLPVGAAFESRVHTGYTWRNRPGAPILHRILRLEGLDPGFNRGGQVDTFARFIYIHGCPDETTLGRPASRGCIHVAAAQLIPLFDHTPPGALVWVAAD